MPTHLHFTIAGRTLNPSAGRLVRMAYGRKAIIPRTLNRTLREIETASQRPAIQSRVRLQSKTLVIHKEVDSASPLLLTSCCNREMIPEVQLQFTKWDYAKGETMYRTITLTNATVAAWQRFHNPLTAQDPSPNRGSQSGASEFEEIQFVFGAIAVGNTDEKKRAGDDRLIA